VFLTVVWPFRCRLAASALSTSDCTKPFTSTDDCIPSSLAAFLSSGFSSISSTTLSGNCDRWTPSAQFKNLFYSPCVAAGSSLVTSRFPYCFCSSPLCSSIQPSLSYSSSLSNSSLEDKCNQRLSVSSSSDDDMKPSSPDSGFSSPSSNGSSIADDFENLRSDESIDDSSKSSSNSSSSSSSLSPPCFNSSKPEISAAEKGKLIKSEYITYYNRLS